MMGDLLGSPRVAPSFWLFLAITGTISACHLSSLWVRPFPSPSAPGDRRSSIRSQDTGRRNRASEISPRFLRNGRSRRLSTIGGNSKLFGRPSGKLWGETLGGGGGGGVWSARACFMRGQVGRGAWNGR